jgi:hypothetical protein
MGDDNCLDARLEASLNDREDLVPSKMTSRQNEIMLSDKGADLSDRWKDEPFSVDHSDRLDVVTLFGQVSLESEPHRWDGTGWQVVGRPPMVGCVDGRHPDHPPTLARTYLDGKRVHAAHSGIQSNSAASIAVRHRFTHNLGALRGGDVVGLEHESPKAQFREPLRKLEIRDAALHNVWSDVNVGVVSAADQLARPRRGLY